MNGNPSAPKPAGSTWLTTLLSWLKLSLNGLVTIALVVLTWFLASSEFGKQFRESTTDGYKIGVTILGGIVTLLISYWALRGDMKQWWLELARSTSEIAPSFVKPALLLLLMLMLGSAYFVLGVKVEGYSPPPSSSEGFDFFRFSVVGLCALPAILTYIVSLLVERRMARGDFAFEWNPSLESDSTFADLAKTLEKTWDYERRLMVNSIQRMGRHAAILGFLASSIVATCAVTIMRDATRLHMLVALAVGTAASISFTLHLGQIFFRSASNDATARMMAWASRTLLIVSVCAMFFGSFLLNDGKQDNAHDSSQGSTNQNSTPPPEDTNPFHGRSGALLVGVAVALLGERMLRAVTNRAASMLGVDGLSTAQPGDLNLIDGMSEEDAARLAEERIDSVHALAFTPTPRIFFNTVYGLQRICDWQDQALLIERVGRTNALLLREQYFIRGAIAARKCALQLFSEGSNQDSNQATPGGPHPPADQKNQAPKEQGAQPDCQQQAAQGAPEQVKPAQGANEPTKQWTARDIDTNSTLGMALRSLGDDEDIKRLEVFWRSVPIWKSTQETP